MRDLSYGKGRTNPVKGAKLPTLKTIDAWDGKDGEMPVEEDIDLSDVELDPKEELWTNLNQDKLFNRQKCGLHFQHFCLYQNKHYLTGLKWGLHN